MSSVLHWKILFNQQTITKYLHKWCLIKENPELEVSTLGLGDAGKVSEMHMKVAVSDQIFS